MRKKFKVRIGRQKWTIKFGKTSRDKKTKRRHYGECIWDKRVIVIHHKLRGKILLDTILHETEHAFYPSLKESYVGDIATQKMKVLHKLGYRK